MDANTQNDRPTREKLQEGDIVRVTMSDGTEFDAVVDGMWIGVGAEQMIMLEQIDDDEIEFNESCDPPPQELLDGAHKWMAYVGFDPDVHGGIGARDNRIDGTLDHLLLDSLALWMWCQMDESRSFDDLIIPVAPSEWPQELKDYQQRLEAWATLRCA